MLCFDMEQILVLYRPMVDDIACQLGKSTPLAERKAAAAEALCAAAQDYYPGCGDLEAYLENRVRRTIYAQNAQYTKEFSQRSLEQPQENAKNILYGGFDLPPYSRCTFRYSSLMVSVTAISRIRLAGA